MRHYLFLTGRFAVVCLLGTLILAACGNTPAASGNTKSVNTQATLTAQKTGTVQQTATALATARTITIPQGHDLFAPFILTVQPGTKVTWQIAITRPT
jgi:plastocyanin